MYYAFVITTSDYAGTNAHGPARCTKTPRQALERRPNRRAAMFCGGRRHTRRLSPASSTASGRKRQRTGCQHIRGQI